MENVQKQQMLENEEEAKWRKQTIKLNYTMETIEIQFICLTTTIKYKTAGIYNNSNKIT